MGTHRTPGLLGTTKAPLQVPQGTLARSAAAPPGLLGTDPDSDAEPALPAMTELSWEQIKDDMHEHEALIPHLYLDSVDKVTVGVGNMLPTLAAATALAFVVRADPAKVASADQIKADWEKVIAEAGKNKRASAFAKLTSLDLPEELCWSLLKQRIDDEFLPGLRTIFPGWSTLATPAKRALLDMAYNLGLAGLRKFKTLIAHVEKSDWEKASGACSRKGIPDARNEWTRARFLEAVPPRKKGPA